MNDYPPAFAFALAIAQTAVGIAWAFTCACRVHLMTRASHRKIKAGMAILGAGGLFFASASWVDGTYHLLFDMLAGMSVVVIQWVTSTLWSRGVPWQFTTQQHPATAPMPFDVFHDDDDFQDNPFP